MLILGGVGKVWAPVFGAVVYWFMITFIQNTGRQLVDEMLRRCAKGPPDAKVTNVIVTNEGGAPPSGFKVLPTH